MAVNLHATHFRFGINELAESTHGWHAAEDANPAQGVIGNDATFLLRFTVQETGGSIASNTDQQFQCRLNAGAFQDITTTSSIVKAVTTAVFANGADLTKRLSGTGTFESSGDGGTHDGLSGGPQNDIAASGNSETECALQIVGTDVAHNDVIEFRLTSPDFTITNDVVPSLTVNEPIAAALDGAVTGAAMVAAALVTAIALSGALLGSGSHAAALTTAITPTAAITGSAIAVGDLETQIPLATQGMSAATVAGDLITAIPLESGLSGTGTLAGGLTTAIPLHASSEGTATVAADLTAPASIALEGAVIGSGALTADLATGIVLAAVVSSAGAVTGDLSTSLALTATATGIASVVANLAGGDAEMWSPVHQWMVLRGR